MIRYVALIGAAPSGQGPCSSRDWRCVFEDGQTRVHLYGSRDDRLAGYSLADGYCIGRTARRARSSAELADTWGAYVAISGAADRSIAAVRRDPSGRVPAFYARTAGGYVVASHLNDLLAVAPISTGIDWDYLTFTLLAGHLPAVHTGLVGVAEVLPGERLLLQTLEPRSTLDWRPSAFYRQSLSPERARSVLRQSAEQAACFWAEAYDRITLDLSGGLDSAVMLGLLARSPARPELTCLNRRTRHSESDERRFAREAAALHGARLLELPIVDEVSEPIHRELPPRPTFGMLPLGFASASEAAAQRLGAQAYFTGRGGDHLFFSGTPTSAAADYLRRTRNPAGLMAIAYRLARASGRSIWSVMGQALARPRADQRLRELTNENPFLHSEASELDITRFIHPWLLEAADDAPPAKFDQVIALVELQRHYDRFGRADACDETHPFISQPVIEASLATPSELFPAGGRDRGLEREVFCDLIPDSIYRRRSKGGTTSHLVRALVRNLDWLRPLLLEGELTRRHILDRARLEAALDRTALLDGRFAARLVYVVIAQMWIDQASQALSERPQRPGGVR